MISILNVRVPLAIVYNRHGTHATTGIRKGGPKN